MNLSTRGQRHNNKQTEVGCLMTPMLLPYHGGITHECKQDVLSWLRQRPCYFRHSSNVSYMSSAYLSSSSLHLYELHNNRKNIDTTEKNM